MATSDDMPNACNWPAGNGSVRLSDAATVTRRLTVFGPSDVSPVSVQRPGVVREIGCGFEADEAVLDFAALLLSSGELVFAEASGVTFGGCEVDAFAASVDGVCTVPSGAVNVHVSDPEISAGLMR